MNKNLTDITLVIDRSGSMHGIREDAEGGVNTFIKEQAELPGEANLTMIEFDHEYDVIHDGIPVSEAPTYELRPRGSTALLDAVGRGITTTGERLAKMSEGDRPGLVVFVVVTDGGENSSKEFTRAAIKQMVEHQTEAYKWQFSFLAANQDAFLAGGQMGFDSSGTANFKEANVADAYVATSAKVSRMRSASAGGQSVCNSYTSDELKAMNGE